MAIGDPVVGPVVTGGPQGESSTRLGRDISDTIWRLGADIAPLTRISSKNKRSTKRQEYNVLEDGRRARTDTTNGGNVGSGDTELTFTTTELWRKYDVWMNEPTSEQIFVTEDYTTATLTVVRGFGTTAAASFTNGDTWRRLGNSLEERALAGTSLQTVVQTRVNYEQFFSETTGLSEIDDNTIHEGNIDEQTRQRRNTRDEFLISVEQAMIFGEPLKEEEGESPKWSGVSDTLYKTGGLKYWIDTDSSSNVLDAGGALSYFDFSDWLAGLTKDHPKNTGTGVKVLIIGGQKAVASINQWGVGPIQTSPGASEFGVDIKRITTPFGDVDLMQHFLLDGSVYDNYLFGISPEHMGYRYLKNMDMRLRTGIEQPNAHELADEIYGVIGFYITLPQLFGYIKNVSMAV